MLHLIVFFVLWLGGMSLLFLFLKKKNENLVFQDVFYSYLLSTGLGVVFSYAAWKANLFSWFPCIAFIGLAGFITWKLLEKKNVVAAMEANDAPMAAFGSQKKYRPGSGAAADAKANRNFVIGAGVVYLLVLLCFTTFDTIQHGYYKEAGLGYNIGGIIAVCLSYLMVFFSQNAILPAKSGHSYWIACAVLLAGGLWLSTGFAG